MELTFDPGSKNVLQSYKMPCTEYGGGGQNPCILVPLYLGDGLQHATRSPATLYGLSFDLHFEPGPNQSIQFNIVYCDL